MKYLSCSVIGSSSFLSSSPTSSPSPSLSSRRLRLRLCEPEGAEALGRWMMGGVGMWAGSSVSFRRVKASPHFGKSQQCIQDGILTLQRLDSRHWVVVEGEMTRRCRACVQLAIRVQNEVLSSVEELLAPDHTEEAPDVVHRPSLHGQALLNPPI